MFDEFVVLAHCRAKGFDRGSLASSTAPIISKLMVMHCLRLPA